MLLTAKPCQLQQPLLPSSTLPNRTRFNTRRRIIILNNNNENTNNSSSSSPYPPLLRRRNRYRKTYPGETTGITEEMRFVAMRLHNDKTNNTTSVVAQDGEGQIPDTWYPSMEGFLRFLVDNHLVFATLERIVDDSDNVSCKFNNSLQFQLNY